MTDDLIKYVETHKNMNGSHCSKRFYINNNVELYDYVQSLHTEDISFQEKVWLTYHKLTYSDIKCKECDNKPKFQNFTLGYRQYCSKKCTYNSQEFQDKRKATNNIRYGGNAPACSAVVRNKMQDTLESLYGVRYTMQSSELKDKAKNTMIDRYGVTSPAHSPEIMTRRIESFKKNADSYKKNYLNTMNDRYGCDYPLQNTEIREKIKQTISDKYGAENPLQVDSIKELVMAKSLKTRKENWKANIIAKFDVLNIIKANDDSTLDIMCNKCCREYNINNKLLHMRMNDNVLPCVLCNPIGSFNHGLQQEIYEYIRSIYYGEILQNKRTILGNLELDIYLPDINVAFEINGLYWHSDFNKDNMYHIRKKEACLDKNISLMFIWEDSWLYKKEVVKSMIRNRLKSSVDKIFARKCKIKCVEFKEKKAFFDNNHIQGDTVSKYNIGLYFNDTLVMCASFGKSRFGSNDTELLRLASKLNTNVIGGASRLLHYFINTYKPDNIISYCLNDYSDGKIYESIGFSLIKNTVPNYFWVVKDNRRQNRFNFRKSVLVKMGHDKNRTEDDIMRNELKALKCYDSGSKVYKLHCL